MARSVSKAFEESINSALYQGPSILSLYGKDIYLNYTLTGSPIFNQFYMAIPFDGTFLHNIEQP